jgi:hypothetical protein
MKWKWAFFWWGVLFSSKINVNFWLHCIHVLLYLYMSWLNLPWDKTRLLKRFDSASVYNQGKINQNKIYLKLCNIFILIVELVTLTKNINVIFKPNFIYNNTCMQCNQKFTFILDENNTPHQKKVHFHFIDWFYLDYKQKHYQIFLIDESYLRVNSIKTCINKWWFLVYLYLKYDF